MAENRSGCCRHAIGELRHDDCPRAPRILRRKRLVLAAAIIVGLISWSGQWESRPTWTGMYFGS
jgi:hypothetical protein